MVHIDRQIAIWAGWIAGPAFGVAMMASPEYLKLNPPYSGFLFWGGLIVFFVTIVVVVALSLHDDTVKKKVIGPILTMALGTLILGGGIAWYFWPTSKAQIATEDERLKRQLSIPISITPLPAPGYARYSGLYPNFEGTSVAEGAKDPAKYDPPFIGIKDLYISNTSLSKSVTLRIFMIITDKDGKATSLDNEGFGPARRRMGRDDWVTRHAMLRGAELPKFILSPVHIRPQTTIYGSMPFIISDFGFGEPYDTSILEYYANGFLAAPEQRFKFSLRITDVLSGVTINLPIPSDGYRGD